MAQSHQNPNPTTRVSEKYNLGRTQASLEFVDVVLEADTKLFLDPVAFGSLGTKLGDDCLDLIRFWFDRVLDAVRSGDRDVALDLMAGLHEPKETRLGYSGDTRGRGIGEGMAEELYDLLDSPVIKANPDVIKNVEDLALVMKNVDRDLISDITTGVLRRQLIDFTGEMAEKYNLKPLVKVDSKPIWNPTTGEWKSEYVDLPSPDGRPLILVPRDAARWKHNADPGEYYRYEVLPFLQQVELRKGDKSGFVKYRQPKNKRDKRGDPYVTKKSLMDYAAARGDGQKSHSAKTSLEYPSIIEGYRNRRGNKPLPPEPIEFLHEKVGTVLPDWDKLLKAVTDTPTGRADATTYHHAVEALLTALFSSELSSPVIEDEINSGSKRIDIKYTNNDGGGFFHWFVKMTHKTAPWIAVECKNYNSDPKNPEVAQIAGRLNKDRGQLGFMVCRTITDRDALLKRTRDEYRSEKYILVLEDADLKELVRLRKAGEHRAVMQYLIDSYNELID